MGQALAFAAVAGPIDPSLVQRAQDRTERVADVNGSFDVVLASVNNTTDVVEVLREWKARLAPAGGIWLLSAKRGLPGYIDQRLLIEAGLEAGLVDNKVCAVSDTTSAIRLVIRKRDR